MKRSEMGIPRSHTRYVSLKKREKIVRGIERGITSLHGMIAHGRGEAFDYLIGEQTTATAYDATRAAVALLLLAEKPVISINGNVAALVPSKVVKLGKLLKAPLEVNLFHRTEERVRKIKEHLIMYGAEEQSVISDVDTNISGIEHDRGKVSTRGIYSADVVLAPLEDGDRCEKLIDMGKKVITIDLNPLSRTARRATVTIVDDIERAMRNMLSLVDEMKKLGRDELEEIVRSYDRSENLKEVLRSIADRIKSDNILDI